MLALTQEAAQAVEAIVAQPEAPDDAMMRITGASPEGDAPGGPEEGLQLSVVENAQPGDVVVKNPPLAVEAATAEFLDDKVLDADVAEGEVTFKLFTQPEGGLPEQGGEPSGDAPAAG